MFSVYPNCGKPFRIENSEKNGWTICSDVCYDASSLPTGMSPIRPSVPHGWKCAGADSPEVYQEDGFDLNLSWKLSIVGGTIRFGNG